MPIIIFPNTREQVVLRGERLTAWRKIQLRFLGILSVKAAFSDDIYTIVRGYPPILQITDDEAAKRRAAAQMREAEEQRRNPKPGTKPRLVVPGSH